MLTTYKGDAVNRRFAVSFPYLSKAHVFVTVDTLPVPFAWLSDTEIETLVPPGTLTTVQVMRQTPDLDDFVDVKDTTTMTAEQLRRLRLQLLYLIQERSGLFGEVSAALNGVAGAISEGTGLSGVTTIADAVASMQLARTWFESNLATLQALQSSIPGLQAQAANTQTNLVSEIQRVEASLETAKTSLTAAVSQESAVRSTADGALSAQYVVKTEVTRADGRVVVGGIGVAATAADNIGQSEIILMADRLLITPPQDPNGELNPIMEMGSVGGVPTVVFPAARFGDQSIPARVFIDGSLTARVLAAQAVTADKIDGRGLEILDAAGNPILSANSPLISNYLAAGTGGNQAFDPVMRTSADGWDVWAEPGLAGQLIWTSPGSSGAPSPYGSARMSLSGPTTASYAANLSMARKSIPVFPGQRIEAQAWVQVFQGQGRLEVMFRDAAGANIVCPPVADGVSEAAWSLSWSPNLADFTHLWGFATAPAGAVTAFLVVSAWRTVDTTTTDLFVSMPWIGYARLSQTEPSPWSATAGGAFFSVDRLTATNSTTFIDSAAIKEAMIESLSVDKLRSGQIAVGQTIGSTGYAPGTSGWYINGSGYAEFRSGNIGGVLINNGGLQSQNYWGGNAGWRVDQVGNAEFNNVLIRRQTVAATNTMTWANGVGPSLLPYSVTDSLGNTTYYPPDTVLIDTGFDNPNDIADAYSGIFTAKVFLTGAYVTWGSDPGASRIFTAHPGATIIYASDLYKTGVVAPPGGRIYLRVDLKAANVLNGVSSIKATSLRWSLYRNT